MSALCQQKCSADTEPRGCVCTYKCTFAFGLGHVCVCARMCACVRTHGVCACRNVYFSGQIQTGTRVTHSGHVYMSMYTCTNTAHVWNQDLNHAKNDRRDGELSQRASSEWSTEPKCIPSYKNPHGPPKPLLLPFYG